MLTTFACLIIGGSVLLTDDNSPAANKQTANKQTVDKAKTIPKAEFTNAGHAVDNVNDVEQFVKDKRAILLDVREQEEWNAGRLKLAMLAPLSLIRKGQLPEKLLKKLPKNKPIYLHCKSGGRVLMAAKILKPKGYDIRPLRSGYEKLLEAGFDKATPKDIEVIHDKKNEPLK